MTLWSDLDPSLLSDKKVSDKNQDFSNFTLYLIQVKHHIGTETPISYQRELK